jgi:hypothetical protein
MTEQRTPPGPHESDEPGEAPDALSDSASEVDEEPTPSTGVPAVDAVLSAIDDLDELPLEQHLGTYERAHDALRSALDATPDRGSAEAMDHPADPAADEPA